MRNGTAALRTLGFDDDLLRATGHETLATGCRDPRGRPLLRIPDEPEEVRRAVTAQGLHRRRLHGALEKIARGHGVEIVKDARDAHVSPGATGGAPATVTWRDAVGGATRSVEFGVMRVSDTELYRYGYVRAPKRAVVDDEHATARARFARWTPKVVDLIERTDPADLMRHDVHHLGGGPRQTVRNALLRMVPARALARAVVSAGAV